MDRITQPWQLGSIRITRDFPVHPGVKTPKAKRIPLRIFICHQNAQLGTFFQALTNIRVA
jgi:hypothetical protein